jgi:oligopeptide/dipeptide ABC transporter ATP-binding protein
MAEQDANYGGPQVKVGGERKKRVILRGEITSPINLPQGCRFASRCIYAKEICIQENPVLTEITLNHLVACHLAREINDLNGEENVHETI